MSPLGHIQYLGKDFFIYKAYLRMQICPSWRKDNSMMLVLLCVHTLCNPHLAHCLVENTKPTFL